MEKIYIGFSKSKKSFVSKLIQFLEGTEYSHVYIRKISKYGEFVYQASGLMVNFMNINIFKDHNIIIEEYEFDLTEEQKTKLFTYFIKYCGANYSLKTLFQLLFIILGRKIGFKLKFKGDNDQSFICSELGALICKEILQINISEDEDFITPKNLHKYLEKLNG